MTRKDLIRIGTLMGLDYNEAHMFPKDIVNGIVVFDGCNGQRFLIDSKLPEKKIYMELGKSLISLGKRQKCVELYDALSINRD